MNVFSDNSHDMFEDSWTQNMTWENALQRYLKKRSVDQSFNALMRARHFFYYLLYIYCLHLSITFCLNFNSSLINPSRKKPFLLL